MIDDLIRAGWGLQPYHDKETCPDCETELVFMDKMRYRETRMQPAEYITVVVCPECGYFEEV